MTSSLRFDEHLVGQNDVLMHAQRNVRHRLRDVIRFGQRAKKISAEAIKQIELAARAGFDHFRRGAVRASRERRNRSARKARWRFRR